MLQDEKQAVVPFEASLEELERVVQELEKGEMPLEKSIELFEKGMRLSAECKRQIEDAETRVEILVKRGAKTAAVEFDPTEENSAKLG
jgi:exodeoxyribonuclease VII small subunit